MSDEMRRRPCSASKNRRSSSWAPARPDWRPPSRSPASAWRRSSSSAGPSCSSLPRATVVSLRSMELIRSWGVEDAVRAGGVDVEWRGWQSRHAGDGGRRGRCGRSASRRREQAAVLSPTAPACVPQDHLEPVLLEHLRSLGGTRVHLHTEVVGVETGRTASRSCCATCASGDAAHRPRPLPGRRRRRAQPRSAAALGIAMRGPDGARPRRHRALPRAAVAGRRRAPLRHLLRRPPGRRGHVPARRPRRPLGLRDLRGPAGRRRATRPSSFAPAHPRRRRHRRPRRRDRAHRRLQLRRPAGRPLPRRPRASSPATPPTA